MKPLGDLRYFFHSIRACFLVEALSDVERQNYSVKDYNRSLMPDRSDNGLFDWEEAWFTNQLPPAPAKILVTAAGTGREAIALKKLGYSVDALEPAPDPAWVCKKHLGPGSTVALADFAQLTTAVLNNEDNPASAVNKKYDAVILGWGGINHVLCFEHRVALLQACNQLCPEGPLLVSFFMDPHAVARQQSGPGSAIGRFFGQKVARIRDLPQEREPVELTYWGGFIRHFGPQDIHSMGKACGRLTRWQHEGGFPHVTYTIETANHV